MPRLLFFFLLGLVLYLILRKVIRKPDPKPGARREEVQTFRDPVCGVYVTPEDAVVGKLDGERLYFCSIECLEKYRKNLENTSKE